MDSTDWIALGPFINAIPGIVRGIVTLRRNLPY
jgi:hypothetical protein